ncbi:MAG: spermidine/putrescine ABC transporter substrate-binding protein [Kineosporiaceae bacterium]
MSAQLGTTGLTRRSLLTGGTALGAGLLFAGLTGCSSTTAADTRVSFLNWQDYVDPTILRDFTTATGLEVGYETYESNDALAQRLSAADVTRKGGRKTTSFDLIVPSSNLFRQLRETDALRKLDTSIVTEALLGHLDPAMRRLDVDPGNAYAVPWATGFTGIGYDSTVFSTPPTWDTFADATHKGKMSLLRERREAFAAALFALGKDPNSTSAADITAAQQTLREFTANATLNSATYLDDLAEGRLVMAQGFNTDVLQARKRNPKLAFTIPKQGGTRWVDLLCVPASAPNAGGANRLIAFYLDPKVSAANAAYNLVSTGNQAAKQFVPTQVQDDPAVFPSQDVVDSLVTLRDLGEVEKLYDTAWEALLA